MGFSTRKQLFKVFFFSLFFVFVFFVVLFFLYVPATPSEIPGGGMIFHHYVGCQEVWWLEVKPYYEHLLLEPSGGPGELGSFGDFMSEMLFLTMAALYFWMPMCEFFDLVKDIVVLGKFKGWWP